VRCPHSVYWRLPVRHTQYGRLGKNGQFLGSRAQLGKRLTYLNVLPNRVVRTSSMVHTYYYTSSTVQLHYSANLDPLRKEVVLFSGPLVDPRIKTRMANTPRNAPPGPAEAPRAEPYMSAAPPPLSGVTAWGGDRTPSQSSPPGAVETPPRSEHCPSPAK
jgi:hypothetical protein